jgi:ribosomal protein S18 acetylase RimI-like enzyme
MNDNRPKETRSMPVQYRVNAKLEPEELAVLFEKSGIRRPFDDISRIRRMIDNANLIVTAWDSERLVGVARALTDWSWCCYLSDLAVDSACQHQGIGRELVRLVRAEAGEEATLILISAPDAMAYYPKIGMEAIQSAWVIKRTH